MKQICVSYCVQSANGEVLKSEYFEGDASIEHLDYIMEQIEGAECFGVAMTCTEESKGFRNVQINKSSVSVNVIVYLNTYNGLHKDGEFGNDFFIVPVEDISVSVLNALYVAMRDDKKPIVPIFRNGADE
nr:MAG TPA: hypothetical protein [Caudoviricetes sp.]